MAEEEIVGITAGEACGYAAGLLVRGLDSVISLDAALRLDFDENKLVTGALSAWSRPGPLRARHNAELDHTRYRYINGSANKAWYVNYVLRRPEVILEQGGTCTVFMLPDTIYFETCVIKEAAGELLLDDFYLYRAICMLPYKIAVQLMDMHTRLRHAMNAPTEEASQISGCAYLRAASTIKDSAYFDLVVSCASPTFFSPAVAGGPALWVGKSMDPENKLSVTRICDLAERHLDPPTLLLSTMGCSTVYVEEALSDPRKYCLSEELDTPTFDMYIEACVLTSNCTTGGPVAGNLRSLLSLYPKYIVRGHLERYMTYTVWYRDITLSPFEPKVSARRWGTSMALRGALEACAPYELKISLADNEGNRYNPWKHNPAWDTGRVGDRHVIQLINHNFLVHLLRCGRVLGLTLSPGTKEYLAGYVLYKTRYTESSEEREELAEKYVALAGPAEREWLLGLRESENNTLRHIEDVYRYARVLEIMMGMRPGPVAAEQISTSEAT